MCHIDVDEFLFAPEPVADVLARVPATIPYLVMEPFEALHDPDAADDIFNGHHFRGLLNRQHVKLQPTIFGKSAPLLEKGALAHTLGKSFCRVGVKKLILDLHFASLNGEVLRSPFHPSLRILHYHAQDPVAWKRALPFRLGKGGAYHSKAQQALHAYLTNANDQEISEFYANSMTLTPEKVALLRANDRLITTDLALRKKVAAMLEGRL
ncbi:MAG: hypothetical protein B7Y02_02675 [Rhodobacterales bacterium 17-64-5]|nr:MAG: hypothetical protein B7Y02_02675 [Rhodobacterales bacterium 17-64-5]